VAEQKGFIRTFGEAWIAKVFHIIDFGTILSFAVTDCK